MKCIRLIHVAFAYFFLHVQAASSNLIPRSSENEITKLAQEVVSAIESAADCDGCEGVLLTLKGIAELGNTVFDEVVTEVCILSGAEDDDVCQGIISAEGPILAHDLRALSIGSHTSKVLCANLLGLCPYPAARPYNVTFPKPKPNTSRPKPSGKKPIQVVHISDTHVDLSYETGASYNCTKPICCRPYTPADAPGNNSYPAGPYGNHFCDPPLRLEINMFNAIEKLVNPAFTIFTGDVVAHDIWLVNRPEVIKDLDTTFSKMATLKLVYPTVGNHDTAPVNAFPPMNLRGGINPQWTYDTLSSDWKKWIGSEAAASVDQYGAYSAIYNGGKLRIISFNSIFYYVLNFWMYEEPMEYDPSGQLAWIVSQLQAAEDNNERVWLIAHVPTGSSDFFRDYSASMDQIINRYDATIAALFYGHTHLDQFELTYSNYSARTAQNARAMSYIAPSMTPTSGSPSFRAYSVDPVTFGVLDFTQYIANISAPQFQQRPVWTPYYSAKATYGPLVSPSITNDAAAELSPAFWHNVTAAFTTNNAAFQAYLSRKTRGYTAENCTGTCQTTEICGLQAADSSYNCQTAVPGLHFSKRTSLAEPDHVDLCGESRVRGVFRALVGRVS